MIRIMGWDGLHEIDTDEKRMRMLTSTMNVTPAPGEWGEWWPWDGSVPEDLDDIVRGETVLFWSEGGVWEVGPVRWTASTIELPAEDRIEA